LSSGQLFGAHRGCQKHEQRPYEGHELARRLFFANQGAFRTGDYEETMNKVSALALLSNAVLVWNTVRISETVASIEASDQSCGRSTLRGFHRSPTRT